MEAAALYMTAASLGKRALAICSISDSLVTGEELFLYFTKLENMLEENLKTGRKPPHSHYKVIKKWIEEDTAV